MRYALKLDTAKPEDIRTLTIRKGEFGSITLVSRCPKRASA